MELQRGRGRSDVDEKIAGVVGTGISIVTAVALQIPLCTSGRKPISIFLRGQPPMDSGCLIPPRCCPSVSEAEVERLSHSRESATGETETMPVSRKSSPVMPSAYLPHTNLTCRCPPPGPSNFIRYLCHYNMTCYGVRYFNVASQL